MSTMKFLDLLKELAKMLMHHCLSLPFRMRLMLAVTPVTACPRERILPQSPPRLNHCIPFWKVDAGYTVAPLLSANEQSPWRYKGLDLRLQNERTTPWCASFRGFFRAPNVRPIFRQPVVSIFKKKCCCRVRCISPCQNQMVLLARMGIESFFWTFRWFHFPQANATGKGTTMDNVQLDSTDLCKNHGSVRYQARSCHICLAMPKICRALLLPVPPFA